MPCVLVCACFFFSRNNVSCCRFETQKKTTAAIHVFLDFHICCLFCSWFKLTLWLKSRNWFYISVLPADQAIKWRLFERSVVHDMGAVESILGRIVWSMQSIVTKASQKFNGKPTKISGQYRYFGADESRPIAQIYQYKNAPTVCSSPHSGFFYLFYFLVKNFSAMAYASEWWSDTTEWHPIIAKDTWKTNRTKVAQCQTILKQQKGSLLQWVSFILRCLIFSLLSNPFHCVISPAVVIINQFL